MSTPHRVGGQRHWVVAAAALATLLALTGCSTSAGSDDSESAASSEGFPVSIEHALGTTTIPTKPERVVTISWMTPDVVAALGVVPVGMDELWGSDDTGFTPWFNSQVDVLDGNEPEILNYGDAGELDFEQILSLEPDLILGLYSGISDVDYERLSEIAPTVPYMEQPWDGGTWQEMTLTIGKTLGEDAKAQDLVDSVEATLDGVATDHPEFADTTFAYGVALSPGNTEVGLYVDYDPRVRLLTEMGFSNTPSMDVITGSAEGDSWYGAVSLEKLDTVDADIFVAWANDATDVEYSLEDPILSRWAPIAGGHYAFIDDSALGMATSGPTVLSIPWALERYVPMLEEAVAGATS